METVLLGIGSRVNHPAYGPGVIIGKETAAYRVVFINHGEKHVGLQYKAWEIIEALPDDAGVSFNEAEKALIKILKTWTDLGPEVRMQGKWNDGMLILKPGDDSLKSREIPIEVFFHKIVMVRDRLRVMEQRINSSANLSDEEKVNLQQYLTRIYGSLTSFNLLFDDKEDYFVGDRS
jgi:hypothetical protein